VQIPGTKEISMAKKTVLSSGFVRGAAGALSILVIAAGTGLVPVAGFTTAVEPVEPAVLPNAEPTRCYAEPVTCEEAPIVDLPPAPEANTAGTASQSGVTLNAALSQGKIVRGSDGTVFLNCEVRVSDAPRDVARQPVDLCLVLDTSGSMASAMPLLKRATLGIV
jgi:hypothetical protein